MFLQDRLVLLRNEFQTSLWRMWNRNAYEHVFGTYYILWEVGGAFDKDTCKMDVLLTPPSLMFLGLFDIVFWTISRKTVNLLFSLNYSYGTLLVVPRNQLCSLMIYFHIIWQRKFWWFSAIIFSTMIMIHLLDYIIDNFFALPWVMKYHSSL